MGGAALVESAGIVGRQHDVQVLSDETTQAHVALRQVDHIQGIRLKFY